MHGLPGSTDHDLNSQLRQYAADKSSRDYCFGMPEPKNSVVCGIHLQLQVIVQGDKIPWLPWYYHDSWYRYHTYFLSKRFPNLLMSSPVPSFPWTRLLTCPVLNPFSPISRYSVSSLVNRIVNRWSTVDRWIASIFGQWLSGLLALMTTVRPWPNRIQNLTFGFTSDSSSSVAIKLSFTRRRGAQCSQCSCHFTCHCLSVANETNKCKPLKPNVNLSTTTAVFPQLVAGVLSLASIAQSQLSWSPGTSKTEVYLKCTKRPPKELDVQPWIQPGPGETILNQTFLVEIFLGVGGSPPPLKRGGYGDHHMDTNCKCELGDCLAWVGGRLLFCLGSSLVCLIYI